MKKLLAGLLFCLTLGAVTLTSPATVSGDGASHAIGTSGTARVIILSAWPTNATTTCSTSAASGCVWIGDSNVSSSRGQFLLPGTSVTLPDISPVSGQAQTYSLATVFYLAQTGDKISITLVQ